jgi:hypothetical protein
MPHVRRRLNRSRGGRPPLPPEEKRSVKTALLWTPAEAEAIDGVLVREGLDFNAWARPILLEAAARKRRVPKR